MKDPREVVADVLYDHFGDCNMSWKTHLEQADEILNSIHYHELIDLIMQNDKEIAELKDINTSKTAWVVMQLPDFSEIKIRVPKTVFLESVFFDREEALAYCRIMNRNTDPGNGRWWVGAHGSRLNPAPPEGETSWVEAAEKANND